MDTTEPWLRETTSLPVDSTTYLPGTQNASLPTSTDGEVVIDPLYSTPPLFEIQQLDKETNKSQSDTFKLGITILYCCGESAISMLILIGNSLVLRAIHTERKLQTFTNYFISSLAIADLLVGALGIPLSLVAFFGYPKGFIGCLFVNTLVIMLTQISIFGLVTISIERYVAIRYPFFYQQHSRTRNALIAITISWVLAILVGMVPIMGWNLRNTYDGEFCNFTDVVSMEYMVYFNFFGFVLGPLVLMFCLYCYIFVIVRQQMKMIAKQQIGIGDYSPQESNSPRNSLTGSQDPIEVKYTLAESVYSLHHPDMNTIEKNKLKRNSVYAVSTPNLTLSVPESNHIGGCELTSIKRRSSADVHNLQIPLDVRLTPRLLRNVNGAGNTPKSSPRPKRANEHAAQKHASAMRKFIKRFQRDLRAAKWFAIVIAVFALCWLPIHILNTLSLLYKPMPVPLVIIAIILSHANSAVNPVLYAYSNTKFKAAMVRLICCRPQERTRPGSSLRKKPVRNGRTNGPNAHVQNGGYL